MDKQLLIDCHRLIAGRAGRGNAEAQDVISRLDAALAAEGVSIHPMPPMGEWWCPHCSPTDGAGCGACPDYPKRKQPDSGPVAQQAKDLPDVFDSEIDRLNEKLYGSGRAEMRGKPHAEAYCLGACDALVAARHRFKTIAPMLAAQGEEELRRDLAQAHREAEHMVAQVHQMRERAEKAEAKLAAQPVAQTGVPESETGWLLERNNAQYYCAGVEEQHNGMGFCWFPRETKNHLKALRFARCADAEKFAKQIATYIQYTVVEHAWIAAAPKPKGDANV